MKTEIRITDIDQLYKSIAPKILDADPAKKLLFLQLFTNPEEEGERLNLLMVGEPSTGKSVLMRSVLPMYPSSLPPLSPDTTPRGLQEAADICDGSALGCDDFDKWGPDVWENMLELMQFGECTVNMKGKHIKVSANLNTIAACNPKGNKLSRYISLVDQVPFSLPVMTRFHLVIPFYSIDSKKYGDVAVSMVTPSEASLNETIRNTIINLREQIPSVHVPAEIARKLGKSFEIIKRQSNEKDMISPRSIEGGLNLLKAASRLKKAEEVDEETLAYVIKIFESLYLQKKTWA